MVDKFNQWNDDEYTEDVVAGDSYYDEDDSIEYADSSDYEEDYENTASDYERDYEEQQYSDDEEYSEENEYSEYDDDDDEQSSKGSALPLIIVLLLFLLLLGGGIFYFLNNKKGTETQVQGQSVATEAVADAENVQNTDELADLFFNEAGGSEEDMMSVNFDDNGDTNVVVENPEGEEVVATVSDVPPEFMEQSQSQNEQSQEQSDDELFGVGSGDENSEIMVSYNKNARVNPFKPLESIAKQYEGYARINDVDFEIIEPPTKSVPDENLTKLLQTQISGILYDEESPAAIVNLNGSDQFVKVGDVVLGYRIENITKNQVQISYKSNTYVASVGELFTRGSLEKQNAVVNLDKKFAGNKRNN